MTIAKAVLLAENELRAATAKHGKFHSAHEGWAVIREEMDELWEEVKRREPNPEHLEKEAIQVAAMALRFLMDIC